MALAQPRRLFANDSEVVHLFSLLLFQNGNEFCLVPFGSRREKGAAERGIWASGEWVFVGPKGVSVLMKKVVKNIETFIYCLFVYAEH